MRILLALALSLAACDSSTTTDSTNKVLNACVNVCSCFSQASAINNCRDDCQKMSVSARVRVGRAFSGGSASFTGSVFWGSGSASQVASSACLDCLGGASCSSLEGGSACLSTCQSLIKTGS